MRRVLVLLSVLVVLAAGCGSGGGGGSAEDPDTPPEEPVKIRMGWTVPGEELKYLMQQDPSLASNLGTWYEIEFTKDDFSRPPEGAIDSGALQANWDFFREQGTFGSELQVENHIDPELLPGAAS